MSSPTIFPIRFSAERCPQCQASFDHLNDRLNRAMVQLELQLRGLQDKITRAAAAAQSRVTTSKPGYPGIAAGSSAIIGGPTPGGPSPLPPWLTHHSMLVGEGSTPVRQIVGTDGQIPIAASDGDPAFGNIGDSGNTQSVSVTGQPVGVAIVNDPNTITVGLDVPNVNWIVEAAAWMLKVAIALDAFFGGTAFEDALPSPNPPAGYLKE